MKPHPKPGTMDSFNDEPPLKRDMNIERQQYLVRKTLNNTITEEERVEMLLMMEDPNQRPSIDRIIYNMTKLQTETKWKGLG